MCAKQYRYRDRGTGEFLRMQAYAHVQKLESGRAYYETSTVTRASSTIWTC